MTTSSGRKHAGPGPASDQPPVPEPTFAERARTLVYLGRVGSLSTLSRKQPGFPFGSVMPYGLDDHGRPIFLISTMAMHTQNLLADTRAGLLATQQDTDGEPLGASRVTLVGNVLPVSNTDLAEVRELYLERHANSKYWVDFEDFSFYRMDVIDVYYVGGFGVMGWVSASDYDRSQPDPHRMMDVAAAIGLSEAEGARIDNIVEIALEFSGMLRVFEEGSNVKIIPKLRKFFDGLGGIEDKAAYDRVHGELCDWFVANIRTAEKKLKGGGTKASVPCSYGHGAKVLDIATKVYVYYCGEPSAEIVARLLPILHAGLDTPMMQDLDPDNAKDTIQEVDRAEYERLQGLVAAKIAGSELHAVQYDDVMWRRLQRGQR